MASMYCVYALFLVFMCVLEFSYGDSATDPCDVEITTSVLERELLDTDVNVIDKQVPDKCVNGTFMWSYPKNTVHLHFPSNSSPDVARSVCVQNDMLGNIFTVRDITHVLGMPMIIGDKESCTAKHHDSDIVLRIDAPEELYRIAAIFYHVYVE